MIMTLSEQLNKQIKKQVNFTGIEDLLAYEFNKEVKNTKSKLTRIRNIIK